MAWGWPSAVVWSRRWADRSILKVSPARARAFSCGCRCGRLPPPQRLKAAPSPDESPSSEQLCILVADDNPLNRQIASLQLRRHWPQARVIEAANGLEALHQLQAHGADVVLMDLLMPDMDGLQAVRCIRRDLPEPLCKVPVIALTANNDPAEWARCMDAGMNACMLKPFDRQKLIRTLQDLLG